MDWQLLSSLPETERRSLISRCRRRRYPRGGYICHEGEPGDSVHLIAVGTVSVLVTDPLGTAVTLDVLRPGDSFGEQCLIGEESLRSASVVALEKTETLSFTRGEFEALWDSSRDAALGVARMLDSRLRATSQALLEALYLPAETRVLRRLAYLAEVYGDHRSKTVPVTQDDLASMAGTTRQTVNRVLSRAQEDGLVELARGRIVVTDEARLARRARTGG